MPILKLVLRLRSSVRYLSAHTQISEEREGWRGCGCVKHLRFTNSFDDYFAGAYDGTPPPYPASPYTDNRFLAPSPPVPMASSTVPLLLRSSTAYLCLSSAALAVRAQSANREMPSIRTKACSDRRGRWDLEHSGQRLEGVNRRK